MHVMGVCLERLERIFNDDRVHARRCVLIAGNEMSLWFDATMAGCGNDNEARLGLGMSNWNGLFEVEVQQYALRDDF